MMARLVVALVAFLLIMAALPLQLLRFPVGDVGCVDLFADA